jgi:hypothetical protein
LKERREKKSIQCRGDEEREVNMQSRAERSAGAVMAKMALLEVSASIPLAVLGLPTLIEYFLIFYY